jgi:hypothetical protein
MTDTGSTGGAEPDPAAGTTGEPVLLGDDAGRTVLCAAAPPAGIKPPPGTADAPGTSPDPLVAAACVAATGTTVEGTSGTRAASLDGSGADAAPRSADSPPTLVPWHLSAEDRRFHGATARLDAELRTEWFKVRKTNGTLSLKKHRHTHRGISGRGRLAALPLVPCASATNGRLWPAWSPVEARGTGSTFGVAVGVGAVAAEAAIAATTPLTNGRTSATAASEAFVIASATVIAVDAAMAGGGVDAAMAGGGDEAPVIAPVVGSGVGAPVVEAPAAAA